MSGQNAAVLDLPPGVVRNGTPHSVGKRWWDVNWVRWVNNQLQPIGGWVKGKDFGTSADNVIRDAISWRDNNKTPWYVVGRRNKIQAASPISSTIRDITPVGLFGNPTGGYGKGFYGDGFYGIYVPPGTVLPAGAMRGFGAGLYGRGNYGLTIPSEIDGIAQWSMDNFGRYLVAVHSQDGRLFSWDPTTPATRAVAVTNAPTNNTLVVVTDERMIMVLGGKGNPRRVKWCDRENMTSWTASATNTAGGFEINSSGAIVAAARVQGGILVLTDVDAHIIEYVGAPYYYAQRRLSDEVGCIGKNCLVSVTGMGFWLSREGFWRYDGAITSVPSDVDADVFQNGNLTEPANVFLGYNAFNREIWVFYPEKGTSSPNRYVFVSIAAEPYWSKGAMSRTAFLNPIWGTKPFLYDSQQEYQHEVGLLADGASRVSDIYAETGEFEIGEGDRNMRVDRIWPDGVTYDPLTGASYSSDYELLFKLRQAPAAPLRVVGPVSVSSEKGYSGVRFRARSMQVRLEPVADTTWALGKLRLRLKEGGAR